MYESVLKKNVLFSQIKESDFDNVLECLAAYTKKFRKNEIVRYSEKQVLEMGIVLKGSIHLSKMDYHGNRMILSQVPVSKTFGESLSITEVQDSPIIVTAATETIILFIPIEKIVEHSPQCVFHERIVKNFIKLLAEKNMLLQKKIDILSQKTIRDKLLLYFDYESRDCASQSFDIILSREELADFLSLNQSALSRELSKMRDDGLLTFRKSKFTLNYSARVFDD